MTGVLAGEPVIRLSSVAYTYRGPPPVTALKPTSMVIYRGEHVAITGPSGSGKSTLLNLLGLLDKPTQGSIEIDGINVGTAPERQRAAVRAHRIGFVFQSFHLLPYRTSIENVMLAQVYADEPRRRRHAAAMAALAQVGLDHRAHALPTALSGGERQRVAIARALVNRPSLLMCDEPTGNLDTVTTLELSDLLESLHRAGATLVVITHNPVVAARAQRQIAIRDGELREVSSATPALQTAAPESAPGFVAEEQPRDAGAHESPPSAGAPRYPPTLPEALPGGTPGPEPGSGIPQPPPPPPTGTPGPEPGSGVPQPPPPPLSGTPGPESRSVEPEPPPTLPGGPPPVDPPREGCAPGGLDALGFSDE
jgi:putative ABC transport system ATP-binding protein